ncbi:hypothetical protein [Paraburkholderia sp. HD33-4]|uniref:hypothetical protein n=1 Tax=Paraburkholderia sp. HD33-4 TaxID=2883242 RepID=UPI001F1EEC8C|nr:hypothetical protein [Paraburkholderia sp. HD33-4]
MNHLHISKTTLQMRAHLAHENERMREALRLIATMAETGGSAIAMIDIARIARNALISVPAENVALRPVPEGENHEHAKGSEA